MANRFVSPQQQFVSFSGQPYAGGQLFFYISGTSTPTPTYDDEGLTTPNTNPVILDSAGDAGNIFLDPGIVYKVVLEDSNNNQIWTFDPVIPTDSNTAAGFAPVVSCNASGTNSITLTPITPSQQPALYSNFQVFAFVPVSTTTGPVSLQVGTLPSESVFVAPGVQAGAGSFVAGNGPYFVAYGSLVAGSSPAFLLISSSQSKLPVQTPQGYLTLTSQTPVIATDVVGSTNIFYTPLIGLGAPIHNGASIVSTVLPGELSLALTSSQTANNIYDIYLAYNGGSPVIGTGPSWAAGTGGSITAGSCARGTGAGGAAIARTQGIWTNAAPMNLIYNLGAGNITLAVPANQGIYLGSIFIDSTAGQVSAYRSYGQSRKFGVWNAYNRMSIKIIAGDSSSSWSYTGNVFRAANGNSANSITVFQGLPEEQYDLTYHVQISVAVVTGQTAAGEVGIGFNSTTIPSGSVGATVYTATSATSVSMNSILIGEYIAPPSLGTNVVTALEDGQNATAGTQVFGGSGQALMQLIARYRG